MYIDSQADDEAEPVVNPVRNEIGRTDLVISKPFSISPRIK